MNRCRQYMYIERDRECVCVCVCVIALALSSMVWCQPLGVLARVQSRSLL